MTDSERMAYCTACNKKKFDPQVGILCSIDNSKPSFEEACPIFDGDIDKVKERIENDNKPKSSGEIGGFLSWYLFFVGIGSIATVIFNLATFNSEDYSGSWFLAIADIISWVFYCALGVYVIVAFSRKMPNAVTLAKIHLVTLVIMNSIVLLSGDLESSGMSSPTRLVGSLIWSVIFFIYLSTSERVKDLIPKETRHLYKWDKICLWGTVGLFFLFFIIGILDVAGMNPLVSKKSRFEKQIAAAKAELPLEINEYLSFTDIDFENDALVLTYKYLTLDASNYDFPRKKELSLMDKERRIAGLYTDKDEYFADYVTEGYSLVARFMDKSDDFFYEYKLSTEEYLDAYLSTGTYATDEETFEEILNLFNISLPDDYIGGTILNSVSKDVYGDGITYELTIPGMTVNDLDNLTRSYLYDYLEENYSLITDDMMELAYMNNYDVTFRFSVDCSSWWSSSVTFTPEEYKKLVEF